MPPGDSVVQYPWVEAPCTTSMTDAARYDLAWRPVWIVVREYYRFADPTKMAPWDAASAASYGAVDKPDMSAFSPGTTAAQPLLDVLFKSFMFGWDGASCSLNQLDLAELAFAYFASDAPSRTAIISSLQMAGANGGHLNLPSIVVNPQTEADPIYTQNPMFPAQAAQPSSHTGLWVAGAAGLLAAMAIGFGVHARARRQDETSGQGSRR